jgi:hypothetical protein
MGTVTRVSANDRAKTGADKLGGLCVTWMVEHTRKNGRLPPDGLLKLLSQAERTVFCRLSRRPVFRSNPEWACDDFDVLSKWRA